MRTLLIRVRRLAARLSWPEWVIVLALVLLVVSSVGPAIWALRASGRLDMALNDVQALQRAIIRYQREYGAWPAVATIQGADVRYGARRPNASLMRLLRGEADLTVADQPLNAQRMIFIEIEPYRRGWSGLSAEGEFLDPWGIPYQIVVDSNFDTIAKVENSIYGGSPGVGVLVWSCGPDRRSETKDDIRSWR